MNFSKNLILLTITLIVVLVIVFISIGFGIDKISNWIGVSTPIILITWFYYSQKQTLSKSYFNSIDGTYAGYTQPTLDKPEDKFLEAGIIFHIRDTNESGYFIGELEYKEIWKWSANHQFYSQSAIEASNTFLGKINFEVYRDKMRHPFKPPENRIYKGILTIVDRLDFQFESYKIEDYVSAEYNIDHYREMQTMKFTLIKKNRPEFVHLPNSFTLYKSLGFDFEPYSSLKSGLFLKP